MNKIYIFKINNTFSILNKYNEYNLYVYFSGLINTNEYDLIKARSLFISLTDNILSKEKEYIYMLDDDNYIINNNIHYYNDYLNNEKSKLIIHNNYISIYSNKNKPIFLNNIANINNMFYVNFKSKEYGWLN